MTSHHQSELTFLVVICNPFFPIAFVFVKCYCNCCCCRLVKQWPEKGNLFISIFVPRFFSFPSLLSSPSSLSSSQSNFPIETVSGHSNVLNAHTRTHTQAHNEVVLCSFHPQTFCHHHHHHHSFFVHAQTTEYE